MFRFQVGLLKGLSVFYLCLPNFLFHAGWFRKELALITIGGLGICLVNYAQEAFAKEKTIIRIDRWHLFLLGSFSIFLVVLSGIGGFSYQTNDYVSHNAKFYDLSTNTWPVYFREPDTFGCYYWGFYLVPAFISKCYGALVVSSLVLWTFLGVFLGVVWVFFLLQQRIGRVVLFFVIGGTGHTLKVIYGIISGTGFEHPLVFIEVWSQLNQLLWVPNQLIPCLLLTSLLYYEILSPEKDFFSCFSR